jgi:catechol 2,3-dioxygenase-like lactoylglutathione lyase family enzyme
VLLGIDHVVLAVEDPDATVATLAEKLGLDAAGGGRHEALGTFNRLVWLGDSYLELIGVFDRERAADSWIGRPVLEALGRGGGLATWAVAVDDLDRQLTWLPPDAGFVGPLDGERARPDGRVVRWRLAHPPALSPTTPFLIEHDRTGAEWTPEERAAREAERHANGARVRLTGIEAATETAPVAAGRLRRLLSTSAEPAGRGAVRVVLGGQEIRVVVARARGAAAVDLLGDVQLPRRRSVMVGDCEIRLSGPPVAPLPADAGDGSGTHQDGAGDV